MEEPWVGQSLGPYRIAERLGRGGMAEVYLAYREGSSELLALKILLAELALEEGLLARFRREARIASTLRHPNIARVHDFEVSARHSYLVMEYLPGGTLQEWISSRGALSGTLAFLAPERVRGQMGDGRSDIYSLGLVLYEMVTGQRAVTGDTPLALISKHLEEIPADPTGLLPGMPAGLGGVILKAIEQEPARRYQTAADLRESIARQVSSRSEADSRAILRQRPGLLLAAALSIAAVAWAVLAGPLASPSTVPTPMPATPTVPTGAPGRIVGEGPAAVRSGPGPDHPVIGQVSLGAEVRLLRREGSWYAISFPSTEGEGWVEAERILRVEA